MSNITKLPGPDFSKSVNPKSEAPIARFEKRAYELIDVYTHRGQGDIAVAHLIKLLGILFYYSSKEIQRDILANIDFVQSGMENHH